MSDSPQIQWELVSPYGISIDERENAWWSAHVEDVLELDGGDSGLPVAVETGGVWTIATNGASIPLSNNWDNPDVNCLAAGPDGPHHFFAGCTNAIIYESDVSEAVPLLGWQPVDSALPSEAERFAISQHDLPPLLLVRS